MILKKSAYRTWSSIIVCSNRGPTIAAALGIWLLDHISFRFGACVVRSCSAFSTLSCSVASKLPSDDRGVALVDETFWIGSIAEAEEVEDELDGALLSLTLSLTLTGVRWLCSGDGVGVVPLAWRTSGTNRWRQRHWEFEKAVRRVLVAEIIVATRASISVQDKRSPYA